MLGRKKPAPEPLSLSSTVSSSASKQQNRNTLPRPSLSSPLSSPTPVSPGDAAISPAVVGQSPTSRARPSSKRPQTAKAKPSQGEDAASPPPDYSLAGFRRPSQPSPNPPGLPLASPTESTPFEQRQRQHQHHQPQQHDSPGISNTRRVPSGDSRVKGSFLHLTKPSRSAHQLVSYNQRPASGSWNQFGSKGSDGPGTAGQADQWQQDFKRSTTEQRLGTSPSDNYLAAEQDRPILKSPTSPKKSKPKGFGLLTRTKSGRDKDGGKFRDSPAPMPPLHTDHDMHAHGDAPLKTAPVSQERSFRDMMDSQVRNRSASRSRDKDHRGRNTPPPIRENGGSTFLSGLRNSSTKAAGMFGKGFFGKGSRGAGGDGRTSALDDEHYELKVLNLPLVAQTRKTRISKRLENSRDKTEFWMPAFPWRAIDYLNYKGCEVEGLYRVPGSGPQVKRWQRRFDEAHDVNLFEVDDLYDINVIGSMLKAWLRELPDELFPKAAQDRVYRESAGADKVPQVLIDELSNLSPFQYYLLFAITCHLSLLLAHSDKNKMDFRNLCICFQPCMRIDSFCFKFLVCDWRDCWAGCKNEAAYIEQEYILFDQPPPRGFVQPSQSRSLDVEQERAEDSTRHADDALRQKTWGRSDVENSPSVARKDPKAVHMPDTVYDSPAQGMMRNETHIAPLDSAPARDRQRQPSPTMSNKSGSSYHSANDKPTENSNSHIHQSESKNTISSAGDGSISTTLTINSSRDRDQEPPPRTVELRPLSPIQPLSPMFARARRTGKDGRSPEDLDLGSRDEERS